jgi:hypothetical protein
MAWHISNALMKAYENSHCSQALVEEYSEANCSDGEQFAPWKLMPSAPDDSCSAKMKDTCHHSPYGMMYVPLTDGLGKALLMWFLEAFRARIFRQPGGQIVEELRVKNRDYGRKWLGSFLKYDHHSSSWKTPQLSLFGGRASYSGIWPRWGMMRDGESFPLAMWAHDTNVRGYGYLASIGTPIKTQRCRSSLFMARRVPNPYEICKKENGLPHPEWCEMLMIWPISWTDTQPLEMAKFRQWLDLHGMPCQENDNQSFKKNAAN